MRGLPASRERQRPQQSPAQHRAALENARRPCQGRWALAQLGGALSTICSVPKLEAALERFADAYQSALRDHVFARLRLTRGELASDVAFLSTLFGWMTDTQAGWEQFFHDWWGGGAASQRALQSPQAALYADAAFAPVRAGLDARTTENVATPAWFERPRPVSLVIEEVETLWSHIAERDDWSAFALKLAEIDELRGALKLSR